MTEGTTANMAELVNNLRANLYAIEALANGINDAADGLSSLELHMQRRFGMIDSFADLVGEQAAEAARLLNELEAGIDA